MSRYDLTPQLVDEVIKPDTLRLERWHIPDIDLSDYDRYTVTAGDLKRIDRIAYKMYGDSALWWAIAVVNRIRNPLCDLVPGQQLLIPKIDAITEALATGATSE